MKKTGIYVRVSTGHQAEEGYSIQEQRERLTSYCKARGWLIHDIYVDAGWSGANLNRPAMDQLIEDVQDKKIDTVLVYKLDRLSRSQKDTLFLIEDIFLPNGVDFVSMQESFDTSTPFGRAMLSILSVFSQLERELISERTFMGRVGRAKEGHWHGGGTDPIGYDYTDGKLVINKSEAEQVRMVYGLYANGYSISAISERMKGYTTKHGGWRHPNTIAQVLDNELYAGTVHFGPVEAPDSHSAIVDMVLNKKVKKRRKISNDKGYKAPDSKYLLTGFLRCARCGARYFAKKAPNGAITYSCHSRAKVNKKMIKDRGCKNKHWPLYDLEAMVEKKLLVLAESKNLRKDLLMMQESGNFGCPDPTEDQENEIADIDHQINKLMQLYQFENMPVDDIAKNIEALHVKRQELAPADKQKRKKDIDVEGIRAVLREFGPMWIDGDKEKRRFFLNMLNLSKILIDGEEIQLDFL